MKTLTIIEKLLSSYKSETDGHTDKEYIEKCNNEFLYKVRQCTARLPHLLYPLCISYLDKSAATDLLKDIQHEVAKCYYPILPSEESFKDVIANHSIETPSYDNLGDSSGFDGIIGISPSYLNNYLLSLLLSLPINKINLTFVELGDTMIGDFFYQNINSKLYKSITNENDFKDYLERLKERAIENRKLYGVYPDFCKNNRTIPFPYEIIILSDPNDNIEAEDISFIRNNGAKDGVFLVICQNNIEDKYWCLDDQKKKLGWYLKTYKDVRRVFEHIDKYVNLDEFSYDELYGRTHYNQSKYFEKNQVDFTIISEDFTYDLENNNKIYKRIPGGDEKFRDNEFLKNIPDRKFEYDEDENGEENGEEFTITNFHIQNTFRTSPTLITRTNITENKDFLEACIEYINESAEKNNDSIVLKQDYSQQANVNYTKDIDTIIVPIGKSSSEVLFRLDTISHVHSFIIGQSGSGKSVFLHNIIGAAILKYAPEDLQLYLLDFKLGGVEFNRYKGIKHIKSLLVDNSDQQITLEILRELRERMIERGKLLRNLGVNNLEEYNKINPNARMPQILLVVDECHEMFRVGNDIPRTISNEISEIVTKIAKEGRSQGVHLILATQTLSGTEISNEILNNISDHYLLKCASVDSERIVEKSSEITSKLQTGQIYYHHVDNQIQFQAYYTNREEAESLIALVKEKAKGHKSNGEFYFNGSQIFKLENILLSQDKKSSKYPVAYIGKNISINQDDLTISLRKDYSENILLLGLNDMGQVTRTTMNLLLSLILTSKIKGMNIQFKILNCLSNDDSIYTEQLEKLEEKGLCEIFEGRKDRSQLFKQLADGINNESIEDTILIIFGQERFRELKMDMEIEDVKESKVQNSDDTFGFGDFSFSNQGNASTSVKTFKEALDIILDKGPELGVHTIMQLDKPSNFLFSDYISPKMIYQKFKHLIMLKSEETASVQLHLNDNIRLETLSKDMERLRAYYYSEESDSYTLFTPYMELNNDEFENLLESI